MIVITTPTGNIGHQVLDTVLTGEEPVRVIVRDPAKLPDAVRARVEVIPGSHGDPAVVDRALTGARALFWLWQADFRSATLDAAYLPHARPAADAVRGHGVRQVVGISALGRGTAQAANAGLVTASLAVDDLFAGTGAAFRALALPGFMDNTLRQAGPIREHGAYTEPLPPGLALPTAATRDIAAIAARLLLDPDWTGQADVPVLGPEDLSGAERAAIMTEVLGFEVRYRQDTPEALHDRMVAAGASPAMARAMVDMAAAKADGLDQGVTRTPRHAVDAPTTYRQWCADVLRPAIRAA